MYVVVLSVQVLFGCVKCDVKFGRSLSILVLALRSAAGAMWSLTGACQSSCSGASIKLLFDPGRIPKNLHG